MRMVDGRVQCVLDNNFERRKDGTRVHNFN
jgi:hypothetical protein